MKRHDIVVEGHPNSDAILRLRPSPGDGPLRLAMLHGEETGTFARVFRGSVGRGDLALPAAIKIQRDRALNGEPGSLVVRKFTIERDVHRDIQRRCDHTDAGQMPVVRMYDLWGTDQDEVNSLPPCYLCRHARHGIALRCPDDHAELAAAPFARGTSEAQLACTQCRKIYRPSDSGRIQGGSLQHDAACAGCAFAEPQHRDECRRNSVLLNFSPAAVLVFDRLDLDLSDYLHWRRHGEYRDWVEPTLLCFRMVERDDHSRGHARLKLVVDVFWRLLLGIESLHAAGVTHLDLNPENVCLRARGERFDAKIIDLGLALYRAARQQQQPVDRANNRWLDYLAPECANPHRDSVPARVVGRTSGWLKLRLKPPAGLHDPMDPYVCVGDQLQVEADGQLADTRVVRVETGDDGWTLTAATGERPPVTPAPEMAAVDEPARVLVVKRVELAPDLYSLGMLLIAVLANDADVRGFRQQLRAVGTALSHHLKPDEPVSGRMLLTRLRATPADERRHLTDFLDHVDTVTRSYGDEWRLAEELVGIALRATIRSGSHLPYLRHRGDDARTALARFIADLRGVREAIGFSRSTELGEEQLRASRLDQAHRVLDTLRKLSPPPADRAADDSDFDDARRRLVLTALDLSAHTDGGTERETRGLVHAYDGDAALLEMHLKILIQLLEHPTSSATLLSFLKLTSALDCSAADLRTFDDLRQRNDRDASLLAWADEHDWLFGHRRQYATFIEELRQFARLAVTLLAQLPSPLPTTANSRIALKLPRRDLEQLELSHERAQRWTRRFPAWLDTASSKLGEQRDRFDEVHRMFRASGLSSRPYLKTAEKRATTRWDKQEADHLQWRETFEQTGKAIRAYLDKFDATVLKPLATDGHHGVVKALFPWLRLKATLSPPQARALATADLKRHLAWLEQHPIEVTPLVCVKAAVLDYQEQAGRANGDGNG